MMALCCVLPGRWGNAGHSRGLPLQKLTKERLVSGAILVLLNLAEAASRAAITSDVTGGAVLGSSEPAGRLSTAALDNLSPAVLAALISDGFSLDVF